MAEVFPRSSSLRDASRGAMSATQRQKFHADDNICPESGHKHWLDIGVVILF